MMNARARHEQPESETPAVAGAESAQLDNEAEVKSRSIRILVDAVSTHRCDYCGQLISEHVKYRGVTVREANGEVAEYEFCGEQCMSAEYPEM